MSVIYTTSLADGLLDQVKQWKGFTSDEQLADYLAVSRRTIGRLRTGAAPDTETVCRLIDITNRPFDKIVSIQRKRVA